MTGLLRAIYIYLSNYFKSVIKAMRKNKVYMNWSWNKLVKERLYSLSESYKYIFIFFAGFASFFIISLWYKNFRNQWSILICPDSTFMIFFIRSVLFHFYLFFWHFTALNSPNWKIKVITNSNTVCFIL